MKENKTIFIECKAPFMHITINRPKVLNALNSEAHLLLHEAFNRFEKNNELQIATITGTGDRSFFTGTDLKERFKEGSDSFPETGFAGLVERFDLTKPIVAFVNGDAIGGGLKIVLSCDLAIAVDHAKFGLPEPKLVLAAKGGLHRLPRQIPLKHVMQIVLTGKLFDAQTALKYGLINQIVEKKNIAKEAQNILDDLIECAPLSLRASKQMIMQGIDALTLKDAYQRNFSEHDIMLSSDDVHEGNRAFP